jgi:iron-sulfur cluster repair protein YtfE (RIC family)
MGSDDIVSRLKADHAQAREQLDAFATADGASLQELFVKLADALVRHEVGEEMVLYPVLRMEPGGSAIADARVTEQSETVHLLAEMERMSVGSAEFADAFDTLRSTVNEHTYAEEEFVFPLLEEEEQEALLAEMGSRYAKLRDAVPRNASTDVAELARAIRESAPGLTRKTVAADVPGTEPAVPGPAHGTGEEKAS